VLAAVERAHTCIVLDPNAQILELSIGISAGGQHLLEVAPVHADVVERPGGTECGKVTAGSSEKGGEFGLVHFARSHRERTVMDRAEAGRMAIDRHVIRRVSEDHASPFLAEQCGEGPSIEGAAAQNPIAPEKPEIADGGHRRPRRGIGQDIVRVVALRRRLSERIDQQIDLAHLEAGDLEAEVEPEQRKILEVLRQ
jgi:hypothetical protein